MAMRVNTDFEVASFGKAGDSPHGIYAIVRCAITKPFACAYVLPRMAKARLREAHVLRHLPFSLSGVYVN